MVGLAKFFWNARAADTRENENGQEVQVCKMQTQFFHGGAFGKTQQHDPRHR